MMQRAKLRTNGISWQATIIHDTHMEPDSWSQDFGSLEPEVMCHLPNVADAARAITAAQPSFVDVGPTQAFSP